MIEYKIVIKEIAEKQLRHFKKSGNTIVLRKIQKLIAELRLHPKIGIGKPERLKHNFNGLWSRRIDKEHRLVYKIEENIIKVTIVSVKGHYDEL